MFLERKFSRRDPAALRSDPPLCPALPATDWSRLPPLVYDVICNLQLLLGSRRGYSHMLPDFGLSPSNGEHGLEARVEVLQSEMPVMLGRYEPRFVLDEVDVDVDESGAPNMKVSGELPAGPGALTFHFGIISRRILSFEYEPTAPE